MRESLTRARARLTRLRSPTLRLSPSSSLREQAGVSSLARGERVSRPHMARSRVNRLAGVKASVETSSFASPDSEAWSTR